ncbi:MAG: DNA methyltransferase [Desulfobacterales bacterium]
MQEYKNNCTGPETVLSKGMFHCLFPQNVVLTPQLNEVYELALAYYESRILTEEELVQNGAYFSRIGDEFTNHYLMCTGESVRLPHYSSSRLKSFFEKNQFRTGYATHGLFPYRGKFHPQMIKALINVMGLKPGDTVLDPMMGSGTVPIEASLMGIRSIGIDASPFCRFMTQVKYNSLTLPTPPLDRAIERAQKLFEIFTDFTNESGQPSQAAKDANWNFVLSAQQSLIAEQGNALIQIASLVECDIPEIYDFLFLAYLDSAGYAERSKKKSPLTLFQAILERYVFVVKKIQSVMYNFNLIPSAGMILEGDSRHMAIEDCSADGIIFSPPYSFAINYLENDAFHLNCIGADINQLKERMIGLRGKNVKEKYESYVEDMDKLLSECARVLKPSCFCTIIIGTNDNQLSKAFGIPKEKVKGLHKTIAELAANNGFKLIRTLARQISGISNTMRSEYILFFKLNDSTSQDKKTFEIRQNASLPSASS